MAFARAAVAAFLIFVLPVAATGARTVGSDYSTGPMAPEAALRMALADNAGVTVQGGYDASFLKLDHDNQTLFDGEDVLDADPVCQCQDTGGHYRIRTVFQTADRYTAEVSDQGRPDRWRVLMRTVRGVWKVYDVIDARGSVRALLERHNACARERLAAHRNVDACALLK